MVPFSLSSVSFGNVCIQMILFGIGSLCCSLINMTAVECHRTETAACGSTFRLRMDDGTFILADPRSNPSCAFPLVFVEPADSFCGVTILEFSPC